MYSRSTFFIIVDMVATDGSNYTIADMISRGHPWRLASTIAAANAVVLFCAFDAYVASVLLFSICVALVSMYAMTLMYRNLVLHDSVDNPVFIAAYDNLDSAVPADLCVDITHNDDSVKCTTTMPYNADRID